MANKERAEKWLDIVAEDLSVAELLYNNGHWLYTGFMCHQVIEKLAQPRKDCRDVDKVSLYIEPILLESGEDSPIYREVMRTGVNV